MLPERANVDVIKVWNKLINQTGGTKSVNENLTKDGRVILCEWHSTSLVDDSGTVIGIATLGIDITSQYKVQQDLLEKELEQREILDSMVDAVLTIDQEGYIISFNKTAEQLFGYSKKEIIGQKINCLMLDSQANNHDEYFLNYLNTGVKQIINLSNEVEVIHKNKMSIPVRLSVAELPEDTSGRKRYIATCQDLRTIKEQEELLRRSQKMDALGKLTGGIAHDYNNMLGVVLGYAELLESLLTEQPHLAKYANQISKAGERGAKLTKRLLSFSRHDTPTQANVVNINDLLLEQQDMLQKTLTARIQLVYDLSDKLWSINLDQSEFEDAVLNMSINAMHAMSDDGDLTIKTRNQQLKGIDALMLDLMPGDYVQLSISDTGSGMDAITKSKLFDPFFSTKGNRGTGLGLSQVFGFVKRAKGIVNVHSRLGHGSKFLLTFPRYINESLDDLHTTITENVDYTGHEKILVVDDELFLLDLLSEILQSNGYSVYRAEGGEQALAILKSESIDLLLSDVIMPGMNGYQLSAIVQEQYPDVRIQLASGYSDERQKGKFDKSLYQNLLFKPYDKETLLQRIRTLLDSKQADPEITMKEPVLTETITWSDKLCVNIPEIDSDHKELLSLLNRSIVHANGAEKENVEVGVILHDLLAYTKYHFQREEQIMKLCNYPETEQHHKAHMILFEEVKLRERQFEQGENLSESLLAFLSDWLVKHIVGMDMQLAEYCKGKESQITEALSN